MFEKIMIQLYSFNEGQEMDTTKVLADTKALGFDGVELFGPFTTMPTDELVAELEKNELEAVSMHVATDRVVDMIPLAKALNIKYIGIGMEPLLNDEAVYAYAKRLNEIGEVLSKEGMMVTYHNHTQEFAPCGDKRIIDVLIDDTNPDYVGFELDAGWCAAAGVDPIEFIKDNAGRIKLVHIKESSREVGPQPPLDFSQFEKADNGMPIIPDEIMAKLKELKEINCPAGDGIVDWKVLKGVAEEQGCEAFIVERERTYEGTRYECLKKDIEYYRSL